MNADGGKSERVAPMNESVGNVLCVLTFDVKEKLLSLPDKLLFPTIPPFGALERAS